MNFWSAFLIYMFYSIIGWCIEICESFIREKRFVNRGFLIGPYCPIYGVSILAILFFLKDYKDRPFGMFIISMVICGLIEYLGSFILEKIFKTRWWDYSHKKFNINGRICLDNLIFFGLGCLLVMYIIEPFILKLILKIPSPILITISLILLIIYITDTIISFRIIWNFKKVNQATNKESTEKVSKFVKETIVEQNKILYRRLVKAFPKLKIIKNIRSRKKEF